MDAIWFSLWPSPLGWIGLAANARGMVAITVPRVSRRAARAALHLPRAARQGMNVHIRAARRELERFFKADARADFAGVQLDTTCGTDFQRQVWANLRAIPYGEVRTYSQIARAVGRPGAARAVGQCNAKNPWAIVVPCHRLVGRDGQLTGYGGGLEMKRKLLELEGVEVVRVERESPQRRGAHAHRH